MSDEQYFNDEEKPLVIDLTKALVRKSGNILSASDINEIHAIIKSGITNGNFTRDQYGINPVIRHLRTFYALLQVQNL